jgi:transcriptional regulator with XRE-family HTH domain
MAEVFQTPGALWVRVQIALALTQRQLADLVGVERRTIQRWQSRGGLAGTTELLKVAVALDATTPELAAEVRAIASQDPTRPTESHVIAAIVGAAAAAVGMSDEAVKPAVEAAFRAAKAHGASVHGMVLALTVEGASAGRAG